MQQIRVAASGLACGVLVLGALAALAQAPKAGSTRYTPVFENDKIRILEYWDKPGDRVASQYHPETLIYGFQPWRRRFTYADGRTEISQGRAGDVQCLPASTHADENIGTTDTHVLLIEFKTPSDVCGAAVELSPKPRDLAYQNGFDDGLTVGRDDRARGKPSQPEPRGDYADADRGYDHSYGERDLYRQKYRDGYKAGYEQAWHEAVAGRNTGDRAYDNGFLDGLSVGRDDQARSKPYQPQPRGDFADADRGYQKSYGDREAYRQQYRSGYSAGYQQGFGTAR